MANNPKLGSIKCALGNQADVYQTTKRGSHFYTRCECCGLMQGTKAQIQQHIWDNTEWVEGVERRQPSNVNATQSEPVSELAPPPAKREPVVDDDFDPNAEPVGDEPEPEHGSGSSGLRKGLMALGAMVLGVGGGMWLS